MFTNYLFLNKLCFLFINEVVYFYKLSCVCFGICFFLNSLFFINEVGYFYKLSCVCFEIFFN